MPIIKTAKDFIIKRLVHTKYSFLSGVFPGKQKFLKSKLCIKIVMQQICRFRGGKSVFTAAIDFVDLIIIDAVDRGDHAVGMFIYLCKAFDRVSH